RQRLAAVVDLQHRVADRVAVLLQAAAERQQLLQRQADRLLPEREQPVPVVGEQSDVEGGFGELDHRGASRTSAGVVSCSSRALPNRTAGQSPGTSSRATANVERLCVTLSPVSRFSRTVRPGLCATTAAETTSAG